MSEEEYRRNVDWLLNNGYGYRAIREMTEELQYKHSDLVADYQKSQQNIRNALFYIDASQCSAKFKLQAVKNALL